MLDPIMNKLGSIDVTVTVHDQRMIYLRKLIRLADYRTPHWHNLSTGTAIVANLTMRLIRWSEYRRSL